MKPLQSKSRAVNNHRLANLPSSAAQDLRQAQHWLDQSEPRKAELCLMAASIKAPEHPEVLRWLGVLQLRLGHTNEALKYFQQSLANRPNDALVLCELSSAFAALDDYNSARDTLLRAFEHAHDEATWLKVGVACDRMGYANEALEAASHVLQFNNRNMVAKFLRARCFQMIGQVENAATEYRSLCKNPTTAARAWYALMELKTIRLGATEKIALENTYRSQQKSVNRNDHVLLGFALGKALEDDGDYERALGVFKHANECHALGVSWDPNAFHQKKQALCDLSIQSTHLTDSAQGKEVIFLVGLPRSGSTLFEQILASHPSVEGASELPYLDQVLHEESTRRNQPFLQWAQHANADDWQRLGRRYLECSARWRANRPIATDKLPSNWLMSGVIHAMLPKAKIIDCRRDPIETAWSCYKQLFVSDLAGFSYDFDHLAQYWNDYTSACNTWQQILPGHFRTFHYDKLLRDPESQIRQLLNFCELEFHSACLEFHHAKRIIRTPSAAQVREPLRSNPALTERYGDLLNPLRAAFGIEVKSH